jgi:predicted MFS family arabinose efflux permease
MGVAGLVGTWLIGHLIEKSLAATLALTPLVMATVPLALIAEGSAALPTGILLAIWGLIGTAVPVAWWTWLSRTLPEDAEAGGGLMVAVVQLAITLGAAGGGLLFDTFGYEAAFLVGALLLTGSTVLGVMTWRRAGDVRAC